MEVKSSRPKQGSLEKKPESSTDRAEERYDRSYDMVHWSEPLKRLLRMLPENPIPDVIDVHFSGNKLHPTQ